MPQLPHFALPHVPLIPTSTPYWHLRGTYFQLLASYAHFLPWFVFEKEHLGSLGKTSALTSGASRPSVHRVCLAAAFLVNQCRAFVEANFRKHLISSFRSLYSVPGGVI